MPRPPSVYWHATRRPGRPCWAFSHQGKRYHSPAGIGPNDREAADRWFLETLGRVNPEALASVLAIRRADEAREAEGGRRRTVVAMESRDLRRLEQIQRRTALNVNDVLGYVLAAESRRRRPMGLADQPPTSPVVPISLDCRLSREADETLARLAQQDAQQWGLAKPNNSWTFRACIAHQWAEMIRGGKSEPGTCHEMADTV